MAISSVGIGSGLPVEKLVTQMVDLEKKPLKNLEKRAEGINTQISSYAEIKSLTSKLGDIVSKLSRDSGWNGVNISSSNSTISGTMTGIAQPGTFNIKVTGLAQAQTVQIGVGADGGTSLPKDAAMGGTGTLKLTKGDKAVEIEILGSDTLTKVAAKVNEANTGVQASVVTDADGSERLMLRSKESGKTNEFTAVLSSTGAPADSNMSKLVSKTTQNAQNATVELNGVKVESASNTFANTIPGVSFSVSEITTQAATLTVKADTEGIKKNIQEFVDAYNALNDKLAELTKYDEKTKVAGALQGDSATVSLTRMIRSLAMGVSSGGGKLVRLTDIGIQMQQGGKLTVDDSKLTKGLDKLDDLKALFAAKPDALGNGGGIATNFKKATDELLAFDGTLNNKTDALNKTLKSNQKEQDKVNERADRLEIRMYKQYSALDGKMASINALGSYVSQMTTAWNKSKD
jgi:flagellar hook-associated protein 2